MLHKIILFLAIRFMPITGKYKIQEKIYEEFSDCRINLIEGVGDHFSDHLRNSSFHIPVVRLSVDSLSGRMSKFNETRFAPRRNCELILGSHDATVKVIQSVQIFFQFLLGCMRIVDVPLSSIPLCYEEYTYYILLKELQMPHWRGMWLSQGSDSFSKEFTKRLHSRVNFSKDWQYATVTV